MTDPVLEFIEAFNQRELDRFVAVLDSDVEIHSMRGLRRGVEEARDWATRMPGGVQQEIFIERILRPPARVIPPGEDEGGGGDEARSKAVALIERRWHWDEDGSPAGSDEMAWLFELRGELIHSWRPYQDRSAALHDAGIT